MTEPSESGNASVGQRSRHHKKRSVIPIFVVPGTLGSRLSLPSGELVWNPCGRGAPSFFNSQFSQLKPWLRKKAAGLDDPGPIRCNKTVMHDVGIHLVPDRFNGYKSDHPFFDLGNRVPGFYGCVISFYGELIQALYEELPKVSKNKGGSVEFKTYVIGYDWRQPNAVSARRMIERVKKHRRELRDANYRVRNHIIIAHSMGGFVSRHFCRKSSKTGILYLIASPIYGAPKLYIYATHGVSTIPFPGVHELFLKGLLTGVTASRKTVRNVLKSFPSVLELMPSDSFAEWADKNWLTFQSNKTGFPFVGKPQRDASREFEDCRSIWKSQPADDAIGLGTHGLYTLDAFTLLLFGTGMVV